MANSDSGLSGRMEADLRVARLIAAGLIGGVLVSTFVAAVLLSTAPPKPDLALPVPLPALGLALGVLPTAGSFVMKGILLRPGLTAEANSAEAVLPLYRRASLVALALCEGAAFLLLVLVVLGGGPLEWLAGVLLPLAGMIFHFPTRLALERLLDESRRAG